MAPMLYQIACALGIDASRIVGTTIAPNGDVRVVYTTPRLDVVVRILARNAAGVLRPIGTAEAACPACELEQDAELELAHGWQPEGNGEAA